MEQRTTYLALGDSYTIGEALPLIHSFPYQAVQLLREKGYPVQAPEIVAKTGWTTDELTEAMRNYRFSPAYDFVTLLVGVNNQYRGRNKEQYAREFTSLLQAALSLAGERKERVLVVSIPDWGATPFGSTRNPERVASDIDAFNAVARRITEGLGISFCDITPGSRDARYDRTLVATDELHPSEKEYRKWAKKVASFLETALSEGNVKKD